MLHSSPALPKPVPVLRSLMAALGLPPAALPHLRSLSGLLLLDLLAALLGQPLPLPTPSPRVGRSSSSSSVNDETRQAVEAFKLAIGVLACAVAVDLTSVAPRRAAERHSAELLVLARATLLLAVQEGWDGTAKHWVGKSLRRSDLRRARPPPPAAAQVPFRFETPPPGDLPPPLEPDFSPARHSTPPPPAALELVRHSTPPPTLGQTSSSAHGARPAAAHGRRQASPPRTPPRHRQSHLDVSLSSSFSHPSAGTSSVTLSTSAFSPDGQQPEASPALPSPPAVDVGLQWDTVTRLTAPGEWERRVALERRALHASLAGLGT